MCVPCEAELWQLYEKNYVRLYTHLHEKNRDLLDWAFCEKAAADTHDKLLAKCLSGFAPKTTWWGYWRKSAENRALDRIRQIEQRRTVALHSLRGDSTWVPWEPVDPDGTPEQIAMAKENVAAEIEREERKNDRNRRRGKRKQKMLSEILEEFTRECEKEEKTEKEQPTLRHKNAYERALRGETPEEIAAAMAIKRNYVDQLLYRSRKWLFERVHQKDVHQSVFATFHAMIRDAAAEGRNRSTPPVDKLTDHVTWVLVHTPALCPHQDRLTAFAKDPQSRRFSDIRYHLEHCHRCKVDMEMPQ